eukprot:CAMPEP_0204346422 /NCGR_PEP_ID=MMETSP0469-20131031/27170_1 /ASSEMBLY_ACC=CAM_ASM_000384 /TAXON_ID=2969 /ORGANISM="Oxyrrhis marina" /LENGTH=58 /DNA_ID=CAMNT_0051332039 /DNA_START=304 /DNA_END=480 /DNA_ORIENTATION=+
MAPPTVRRSASRCSSASLARACASAWACASALAASRSIRCHWRCLSISAISPDLARGF